MSVLLTLLLSAHVQPIYSDDHVSRELCEDVRKELDAAADLGWLTLDQAADLLRRCYKNAAY